MKARAKPILKYTALNDRLFRYICACGGGRRDPVLEALRAETAALGDIAEMQIGPDQGALMTILTAAIGARSAIEVGTFTGYSAICIARGLPPGGVALPGCQPGMDGHRAPLLGAGQGGWNDRTCASVRPWKI
jgi:hypothetical protein